MDAAAVKVEVDDGNIIVTLPGTAFRLVYQRRPDSRDLLLTHSWVAPGVTTPAVFAFRAAAWTAAKEKARELGWMM